MPGVSSAALHVYTDASVFGPKLPKGYTQDRGRYGPTFIAWVAWHGDEYPARPAFAGQSFIGDQWTNQAECYAGHHGLMAAYSHVQAAKPDDRPTLAVFHVDNLYAYKALADRAKRLKALLPHRLEAARLCSELATLGVRVEWRHVSGKDKHHKVAHSMTRQARGQVLREQAWRPPENEPAPEWKPPSRRLRIIENDDDIPF